MSRSATAPRTTSSSPLAVAGAVVSVVGTLLRLVLRRR